MSLLIAPNKKNNSNSDKNAKKTKKAKTQVTCVNPIFEGWLIEWKEDAIAKDLQSRHTYSKVLFIN
jgi:hypothetical protein